ncbi:hypothetical protein [Sphingobacterium bovistauri]|uniref:Uncharacterized protein n=1 Tax=Sphingobacterium bovistauri TaxID=2781959 RepID=A0ABS7Z9W5_9SPHI|nr:hypothetical protein [Sphingobacterium bovistauri]MCA5005504.1 hypothetical protein [Sphingobacterium bovistauri]
MAKMFNNIEELLEDMVQCFSEHTMFDMLEERDVISVLPLENPELGKVFLAKTNQVLADHFEIYDEDCYDTNSLSDKEENPILFWKDYLNCFFDLELVDDDAINSKYNGTAFGIYQIVGIAFRDEVNKRIKRRRLNGIRLEYKVNETPMDRNKHWLRTYDKEF